MSQRFETCWQMCTTLLSSCSTGLQVQKAEDEKAVVAKELEALRQEHAIVMQENSNLKQRLQHYEPLPQQGDPPCLLCVSQSTHTKNVPDGLPWKIKLNGTRLRCLYWASRKQSDESDFMNEAKRLRSPPKSPHQVSYRACNAAGANLEIYGKRAVNGLSMQVQTGEADR